MNYYKEAIKILKQESNSIDWKALCYQIAMDSPAALVKAYNGGVDPETTAKKDCKMLMEEGKKVAAIKRCRELLGYSLKDANDWVEAL